MASQQEQHAAEHVDAFSAPSRVVTLPDNELDTTSRVIDRRSRAFFSVLGGQRPDWGHATLEIPRVWREFGCRGDGVRVAILDTGIDNAHEDLRARVAEGQDFTGSPFGWRDVQGHGTHCAGIVAAADNGVGVVGAAPAATLLAGKVLGDDGSGTLDNIARGVDWAVSRKADVISMSLGGDGPVSGVMRAALDRAIAAGAIVVVAAGNSGPYPNTVGSPGSYTPCVTVGAVDNRAVVARFSSRGPQVDICAPGVNIMSTYPNNRYTALSGTSMATPYVAAVAALFVEMCRKTAPAVAPSQALFETYARGTARDLDAPGFDLNTGMGLLSPAAILARVRDDAPGSRPPPRPVPAPAPAPAPAPPAPAPPAPPAPGRGISVTVVLTNGATVSHENVASMSVRAASAVAGAAAEDAEK
jgi:hypothetical protein